MSVVSIFHFIMAFIQPSNSGNSSVRKISRKMYETRKYLLVVLISNNALMGLHGLSIHLLQILDPSLIINKFFIFFRIAVSRPSTGHISGVRRIRYALAWSSSRSLWIKTRIDGNFNQHAKSRWDNWNTLFLRINYKDQSWLNDWLDVSFCLLGADIIISYYTPMVLQWIK